MGRRKNEKQTICKAAKNSVEVRSANALNESELADHELDEEADADILSEGEVVDEQDKQRPVKRIKLRSMRSLLSARYRLTFPSKGSVGIKIYHSREHSANPVAEVEITLDGDGNLSFDDVLQCLNRDGEPRVRNQSRISEEVH